MIYLSRILIKKFLILLILILSLFAFVQATPLNPYSGTGDWIINIGETISDMDITVSGNIIINSADRVSFVDNNLTLDGTIVIQQGSHSFLRNNIVSNSGNVIYIDNPSTSNTFENNTIAGTVNTAIRIMNSDGNQFVNNSINNLGLASYGFYIYQSNNNLLERNKIYTSGVYGLYLLNSNNSVISDNTIVGGLNTDSYSLYEKNSQDNLFANNLVYSNYSIPLMISGVSSSSYQYNDVQSSQSNAVFVTNSDTINLINNTLSNTNVYGLSSLSSDNLVLINNTIRSEWGIFINEGVYHQYSNNILTNTNTSFAIGYLQNSTFVNNQLNTEETGFDIANSNFIYVSNTNSISKQFVNLVNSHDNDFANNDANTSIGVIMDTSHRNNIESNHFYNSSKTVQILQSNYNTINNNTLEAVDGVKIQNSNQNTISNNTIKANNRAVSITNSDSNNIADNKITVGYDGIYISGSQINRIVDNDIISTDGSAILIKNAENWYKKNLVSNNTLECTGITVFLDQPNHGITFTNNTIMGELYLHNSLYNDFFNNTIFGVVRLDMGSRYNIFRYNDIKSDETTLQLEARSNNNEFSNNKFESISNKSVYIHITEPSVNNQFSNNIYSGKVDGLILLNLMNETATVGEILHVNSTQNVRYQFKGFDSADADSNTIMVTHPEQTILDIWTKSDLNNINKRTYQITVSKEFTSPLIAQLNTTSIVEEDEEFILMWNATDIAPNRFELFRNETLIYQGSWNNYKSIIYRGTATMGYHIYKLVVYDTSGNTENRSVVIEALDNKKPVPVSYEKEIEVTEGSDTKIAWSITDKHPDYYEIFVDGIQVATDIWISSEEISFNYVANNPGNHEVRLEIYDSSGNSLSLITTITVTTKEDVTTTTSSQSENSTKSESPVMLYLLVASLILIVIIRRKFRF